MGYRYWDSLGACAMYFNSKHRMENYQLSRKNRWRFRQTIGLGVSAQATNLKLILGIGSGGDPAALINFRGVLQFKISQQ